MPSNRKRKLYIEAEPTIDSSPPPTTKQRKLEKQQRHRPPTSFWDNLSQLWLTPRALREIDRRTVWPAAPVPPDRTGKEDINLAGLKRFARHGGPSLSNLRAYPEPETAAPSNRTMASSQLGSKKRANSSRDSERSSKTRKSSAYDRDFEQHLIDYGAYPEGYGGVRNLQEPHNWEEINARLALPRVSLSPSRFTRELFLDFKEKNQEALTEGTVMSTAFPIITGSACIPHSENLYFGNLKHLTDGSITKAKPDFYDGSRPAELSKRVRDDLGPYIVPSTNTAAPCLPNFFAEGKGPNGNPAVCKRQAFYDGTLGARGTHKLQSYVDLETAYDNNAYTITSTYHGGTGALKLYTTHPAQSTCLNQGTEFRMTQLNGWDMTGNPDSFRQGASALRNARDWAKEKREELIAAANGKVPDTAEHSDLVSSTQSFVSLSSNEPTHAESETSADELALGIDTLAGSSQVEARTKPPLKAPSNQQSTKKATRASDTGLRRKNG
ncbi:MAG: hypothetical protein Q9170_006001 [Blastenia crenularia]